jgi:hypothetical protein
MEKYLKNTDISNTKLLDINCLSLTKWANTLIKERELTTKEFGAIKTIIMGCLKLAKHIENALSIRF